MEKPYRSDALTPESDGNGAPEELRRFGRFTLVRELGRGAQGVVYLAEDTELRRKVALKMLTGATAREKDVRERFRREAELASKLEHPGICGIHEVGEVEEIPYIAMQYVQGQTLAQMIAEERAHDEATASGAGKSERPSTSLTSKDALLDVLEIIERAARALHAAHEIGLVHRDIKPGNIMITADGQPVLLDFGLARDVADAGHTLTETGQIMGTPAYMSAEQLLGRREEIDAQSDVYSLGATLYECLTFRPPFESQSFEELYQLILDGAPSNPKRLNPRIPPDLNTVVEVALERDRGRRYESALDFAEDLRRVRAFEPIQARPAGALTRCFKWARRNPAKAVGVAAVVLFALVSTGFLANQQVGRKRAFKSHLQRSEQQLAAGDFAAALESVALARELDLRSARAVELKAQIEAEQERSVQAALKQAALASAAAEREASASKQRKYGQVREAIVALEQEILGERRAVLAAFAPTTRRGAFARKERELKQLRLEAERLLLDAREELNLAARHEAPWGGTPQTDAAFLSFFLGLWREALETGDTARESLYRTAVERLDTNGEHAAELLGRGTVLIAVDPAGSELFLFRYESHETIRPGDPVPRLVPVPTSGVGQSRDGAWGTDFFAGDPALMILDVDPDSPADRAGLRPGDLITHVQGQGVGSAVFLPSFLGNRSQPGVESLQRVTSLNGLEIEQPADWLEVPPRPDGGPDLVGLAGVPGEVELDRKALRCFGPAKLISEVPLVHDWELECLRGGNALTLQVPANRLAGIRCEATAYALIFCDDNRVQPNEVFEADPGSYLLVARRGGFEAQRLPFVVPRLERVELCPKLLPAGSTPTGFVYVPPGKFVYGGDPEAREPGPPEELELPGYFIGRREVTNREWFEFLEDPEIEQRMQGAKQPIYVPRELRGVMPRENLGGPVTPVMGVSWNDIHDFLAWRNTLARAAGEPWVYDLPSQQEWEKAARGVDGRLFPWGDRFDFANVVGLYRKPRHLYDAPGGFEPRDESPFGVQDAGGHRQEWTRDRYGTDPKAPPMYRVRGGGWQTSSDLDFRTASRGFWTATTVHGNVGFRLVARLRPGESSDQ